MEPKGFREGKGVKKYVNNMLHFMRKMMVDVFRAKNMFHPSYLKTQIIRNVDDFGDQFRMKDGNIESGIIIH